MKQWWWHDKTSLYNHRSIVIVSYHCVIAITLHSAIAPPSLLPCNGITVFALSRHRHRFNFHRPSTQTSMVQWSIMNYETRYRYQTSKSHAVNENRSLHLSSSSPAIWHLSSWKKVLISVYELIIHASSGCSKVLYLHPSMYYFYVSNKKKYCVHINNNTHAGRALVLV